MDSKQLLEIGNRIANERRRLNMTQGELAIQCGLTLKTISLLENGQRELKVDTLVRLCNCFQISADFLLFGQTADADALRLKQQLQALDPSVMQSIRNLIHLLSKEKQENVCL